MIKKILYTVSATCMKILMIPFSPWKVRAALMLWADKGLLSEEAVKTWEKEMGLETDGTGRK